MLAGTEALLIIRQQRMRRAVASILRAFLRTDQDISRRPWGRRCLADHHLRTWCPPNKPPRVSSGLGDPGSNPGGAAHRLRSRSSVLAATLRADRYCGRVRSERLAPFAESLPRGATEGSAGCSTSRSHRSAAGLEPCQDVLDHVARRLPAEINARD